MATKRTQGELSLRTRGKENLDALDRSFNNVVGKAPGIVGLSTAFVGVAASVGAVASATEAARNQVSKIVEVGRQVERSQLTWKALLGSVEATDARIRELQKFAFSAPFTLQGIEESALQMEALGKYSVEAMRAAGDTAAIFGRNITEATEALLGAAKGELEMLKRFGISKAELAREIGVEMKDLGMQTTEDLNALYDAAITVMQRKFGGGMEQLATSIDGKLSMITDAVYKARMKMAAGGLTEGLSAGLDLVLVKLDEMDRSGTFERIGDALGQTLYDALGMAEQFMERHGRTFDVASEAAKNGQRSGFSEYLLEPGLSAIQERRSSVTLARDVLEEMGISSGGGVYPMFGNRTPSRGVPAEMMTVDDALIPYLDQAALILLQGGSEEDAKNAIRSGIRALQVQAFDEAARGGSPRNYMKQGRGAGGDLDLEVPQGFGRGAGERRPDQGGATALLRPIIAEEAASASPGGGWWDALIDDSDENPLFKVPEKLEEAWRPAVRNVLEEFREGTISMQEAMEELGTSYGATWKGMARAGAYAQRGLTQYVLQTFDSQAKGHIKLRDIGKAAAIGMVAGALEAYAELWRKKSSEAFLEAGFAAWKGNWGAAAGYAKIGAGYALLAGTTGALGSVLDSKAQQAISGAGSMPSAPNFDESTFDSDAAGSGGTSRSGGASASPGARLVSAGSGSITNNYSVSVTYQGPVFFNESGLREWFQRDLLPLMQDAKAAGAL